MSDVFISNLPRQINSHRLRKELEPYCRSIGVYSFHVHVIRGRTSPCAIVTFPEGKLATLFIQCFGQLSFSGKPRMQLLIINQNVYCKHSDRPPRDLHMVKSLIQQQNQATAEQQKPSARKASKLAKKFAITGFECGAWATEVHVPATVFNPRYVLERSGTLHFRPQSVLIEIDGVEGGDSSGAPEAQRHTLLMYYHGIHQILTDSQSEIFFSPYWSPKIYLNKKTNNPLLGEQVSRERLSGIDDLHEAYAGFSLIYKVHLKNREDHADVLRLGEKGAIPHIHPKTVISMPARIEFALAFKTLLSHLQNHNAFPFRSAFQLNALVSNGIMPPETVLKLLRRVKSLIVKVGDQVASETLMRFVVDDFGTVSTTDTISETMLLESLENRIDSMRLILTRGYFEDQKAKNSTMAYVHRITITPTGVFSYGPKWEASNRVLRTYKDHQDYFLRVSFCEEDGEQFQHEPRVNADRILTNQFLKRLDPALGGAIVIAGRKFEFLGFSNSSLKTQTCWYMARFEFEGQILTPEILIKQLGDFSEIRNPGRYAARVGQAFSDTIGSALVEAENEIRIQDVERIDKEGKRRNFSDGVGKVSLKMVQRIWNTSEKIAAEKPTVFQIRYAGAKGIVSLDPTLKGDKLCLRKSMVKFEGSKSRNIEICTWATRLPMFLNKPLIKVLEDLGVDDFTFISLQNDAINRLRDSSKSAALAANFLKRRSIGSACLRLPWLFEGLDKIGMNFWDDPFLKRVLELGLLLDLRDIKYRGRIPVYKGATLIGVLDETGLLEEGEIFISTEDYKGRPQRIEGRVLITRSPVHHPGDVQMVDSVHVPSHHPLHLLRNVVVFSQHGDRPLPSMLAGGDLDGDLYNVIYDPRFNLSKNEKPAEYPLVNPVDLGRLIVTSDVAKFFVEFIQNNLLGLISTRHLVVADQQKEGIFHPDCLKLAEMASVAVDFPKTGIMVDRKAFPRSSQAKPDFMAPGSRVLVSKDTVIHEEERDNDDDEDTFVQSWYPSDKILGKLYREINEKEFLDDIRKEIVLESEARPVDLLERLWSYMEVQTGHLPWDQWLDFAIDLRYRYEEQVHYLMHSYSDTPWKSSLSEVEVFVGAIVGREKQTRRQRELSGDMKNDFEDYALYTIGELKCEARKETFAKCMACLKISLRSDRKLSRHGLQSFVWVAMSVLMKEVDDMQREMVRRLRQNAGRRGR